MASFQEVEDFLAHADLQGLYNPAAAHDYYEKHKKLKGRQHGSQGLSGVHSPHGVKAVVHKPNPKTVRQTNVQRRAAKQAAIKAKVVEIQARLDHLNAVLAKLVAEAKGKSGSETTASTTKTTSTTKKDAKPLTAAEKRKAAVAAKKTRAKNKKAATPSDQAKELEVKVADVRKKIIAIRKQLKTAVAKARQKEEAKIKATPKAKPKTAKASAAKSAALTGSAKN